MEKIRIGKDITFVWQVRKDGEAITAEDTANLTLEIAGRNGKFQRLPFEVRDNKIVAVWYGVKQTEVGAYRLTCWYNRGKVSESVVDVVWAVELVQYTTEETFDDIETVTIELDGGNLTFGALRGASAYDVAVAEGFVGTEAEWIASLKKPAEDAAEDAEEAAARAIEAAENAEAAITRAETAAQSAENAAGDANAAAGLANSAANNAEAKAQLADAAANNANTAATEAYSKAQEADAAATTATNAAQSANSAATSANEAASNAVEAAVEATQSAENAQTEAGNAHSAADHAYEMAIGAERVNAQLNGNVLTVTNREGVSTSKNVQGPQGQKGDTGPTGPQGPQGPQGPAATITVGTTTTGAPGTPAEVTNSGTSGAAVLNFIIPQGAKGDKGDKGDTGEVTEEELEAVVDGTRPVALANNLTSWAERGTLPTEDEWEGVVRTSGGDLSIVGSQGAEMISIKAGAGQFKAAALKATGFNLLHDAVAVGTGYYFLVPKMVFGTFGTAEESNGVLFTDNNHDNLKPTVYFKPLSSGAPTSITDGTACTYTDSNGYRFYTTPQAGYLIVSGITFANTCAHIAWSMRYDEFISPTDAADAGSSVALTSVIAAIHNYGYMIGVVSAGVLVSDTIERTSATAVKWTRNCDRVVPTWTNTDNGDGTYTHTATITAMKANGGAALDGKVLTVTGQSVSYTDDTATGSTDYVRYELATPATGTASLATHLSIEDFGLEEFTGAEGSAVVKMQYYANYADILALIAQLKMAVAVKDIASNKARVEHAELEIAAAQEYDFPQLPTMQGQPMKLFGAGTPQEAIVPDGWVQFADGGFDWNGLPSSLGQEYINTSVNSGGHYTAVKDSHNLKWVNS